MEPVVSVIIPVYKVEKYLVQCVNSVLNQSYTNLQIILVDDGSPDNCGDICDEYKKKDKRVTVIHKQNHGLGLARNSGMQLITGKYVVFIDSDDWIDLDWIEQFVRTAEENNADLVVAGYKKRNSKGEVLQEYKCTHKLQLIDEMNIVEKALFPLLGAKPDSPEDIERQMSVWTNLYRTSIIKENDLKFVNERDYLSEDLFFNIDYILKCHKVVLIKSSGYNYRFNDISLSNAYRPNRFDLLLNLYSHECKLLYRYGLLELSQTRVDRTFIMKLRNTIKILVNSKSESISRRYAILTKIVTNEQVIEVFSRYPIDQYRLSLKIPALLIKNRMIKVLWLEEVLRWKVVSRRNRI